MYIYLKASIASVTDNKTYPSGTGCSVADVTGISPPEDTAITPAKELPSSIMISRVTNGLDDIRCLGKSITNSRSLSLSSTSVKRNIN